VAGCSSGDGSATTNNADYPAARNLNLTPEEKRVYSRLFRQADSDSVGVVTGDVAAKFFDKTRLDSSILGEVGLVPWPSRAGL
jgi:hypothetical protein